jgi:hypothetical protein
MVISFNTYDVFGGNNCTADEDPLIRREPNCFTFLEKALHVLDEALSRKILLLT